MFLHDLRIAFRTLVAARWTTLAAVIVLALGTGVNTSVFAVAYGILLRPLPYADASRIVVVSMRTQEGMEFGMPLGDFERWREGLRTLERVAAYSEGEFTLRGLGDPRVVRAAVVTGDFFGLLRVQPVRGTVSALEHDGWVVITSRLASSLAGLAVASTVGRQVTIGPAASTVAAVMPDRFAFPSEQVVAWLPASSPLTRIAFGERSDARTFRLLARLKPGATLEQAREDAQRVMRDIRGAIKTQPGLRKIEPRATVVPLSETVTQGVRPVLTALVAAAILVLLVACGNVASLLVSRAVARSHDVAVRLALGASRWQLVRAVLAESLLVALAASALGAWVAAVLVRVLIRVATGVLPRVEAVSLDLPVLAASAAVALLVAVLCGAAPALNAARSDFGPAFRGTSASASRRVRRLRAAIVTGQIALSIVLLTGAGLVTRTVLRLLDQTTGIQPRNVLSLRLVMSDTTTFAAQSRLPYVRHVLDRARALPGVRAAGIGSARPPSVSPLTMTVRIVMENTDETQVMTLASVTPGYFEALGARLIRGRLMNEADFASEEGAAVLSESAARHLSPRRDPVGRPLAFPLPPDRKKRPIVIGIVGDIKYRGLDASGSGAVYVTWPDLPASVSYLIVRTAQDPSAAASSLARVVREADATLPVPEVRLLQDEILSSIADRRLRVLPAVSFALLAFAVALVGLSAIVARAVAERRRELAIRGALGATPGGNLRMIVRQGALWAVGGVALGLAAAAAVGRALVGLLYGVGPYDPITFAAVGTAVGLAAVGTCYLAARRALRVDLVDLLRAE